MESKEFDYKQTIHDAWVFTQENRKLMMWYSFLPSLLTTVVGIGYLGYQFFSFKRSPLFDNAKDSFLKEVIIFTINFFKKNNDLIIPAIIVAVIIFILWALLPTLCQGGLIQVVARKRKGEHVKLLDGISFGLLAFLPLLEYHLLVKGFSMVGILTEAAFAIRNMGTHAFKIVMPVFIIAMIIGIFLTLLFTYTEFYIVLQRKTVLSAIGKSCKLVILSWQHTFLIGILMLIIGLRVIVNLIAILLVPTLIILSAGFLATVSLAKTGMVIGAIIGVISLLFTAYFNGIIHMFANTVWTYTFLQLIEQDRTKELVNE